MSSFNTISSDKHSRIIGVPHASALPGAIRRSYVAASRRTDPLRKLATIVGGDDTGRPDLVPEVAGVLAAPRGLSRMYADDLEQLEAAMTLYDSFAGVTMRQAKLTTGRPANRLNWRRCRNKAPPIPA